MQVDIDMCSQHNISIDRSVREVTPSDSHDKVMMAAPSNPNPNQFSYVLMSVSQHHRSYRVVHSCFILNWHFRCFARSFEGGV